MDLVKVYPNSLSGELCDLIIYLFNTPQEGKGEGVVGSSIPRVDLKFKKTTDLHSAKWGKEWKLIDRLLAEELNKKIHSYYTDINPDINNMIYRPIQNCVDSGFQIQHYTAGDGYYNYHEDSATTQDGGFRIFTYIWYLNNVEEGGETEFYNGLKIKPTQGSLLIFPATWTYPHRGCMPISNDKYIITGWLYGKL
jgi:hypothetical protein